jgi:hypothetical protein
MEGLKLRRFVRLFAAGSSLLRLENFQKPESCLESGAATGPGAPINSNGALFPGLSRTTFKNSREKPGLSAHG